MFGTGGSDFDPDSCRVEWEDEETEEKDRQLEDRWQYFEAQAGDGKECAERIKIGLRRIEIAKREAVALEKAKAKREARRNRGKRKKEHMRSISIKPGVRCVASTVCC